MKLKIGFKDGEIYSIGDNDALTIDMDMIDTYDIYTVMDKYYNSICQVRHWKQETLESGRWFLTSMPVKNAIWQIKDGWLFQATIYPADADVDRVTGCVKDVENET